MNDTSNQEFPDIDNNNALAATRSAIVCSSQHPSNHISSFGFWDGVILPCLLIVEQQS